MGICLYLNWSKANNLYTVLEFLGICTNLKGKSDTLHISVSVLSHVNLMLFPKRGKDLLFGRLPQVDEQEFYVEGMLFLGFSGWKLGITSSNLGLKNFSLSCVLHVAS